MTRVKIICKPLDINSTEPGPLATFPLFDGQYFDDFGEREEGKEIVHLYLGKRDDLTAAQEQYLDTQRGVISYAVEENTR